MSSSVRASPFRETEWDRRFNNLMDDLENSAAANANKSSESQYTLYNNNHSNKVHGSNSSGLAPDNVLRDLNSALNASSNYIENHRTETGPGSMTEYHEYKTYSTSAGDAPDFDLQEKVQHMMPSDYSSGTKNGYSPLSSANMVSSLQQQQSASLKTSYTSRQVQNSSSSFSNSKSGSEQLQDRPGSRLKQNIEELDTLLYDLNNAQKIQSDAGGDYTASSITPGQISSDDYSFSEGGQSVHLEKGRHHSSSAFNEYSSEANKVPSPSPRRRFPSSSSGGAVLTSPASVRKAAGHHVYQTTTTTTTKTVREHSPFDYLRPSSTTPISIENRPSSSTKNYDKGSHLDYNRTIGSNHEGGRATPGGASSDYGRTTPIPVVHEYHSSPGNADHHRAGISQEYCSGSRSGFSQQQQQEYSSRSATSTSTRLDHGRTTMNNNNTLQPDFNSGTISPGHDTPDYSRSGTMPSGGHELLESGEPKGAAYYAKYHSSHSHKSAMQQHGQSVSFPNSGRNTPSFPTGSTTQQPPKRVDELMTELSEFDPSIQPTNFVEPRPVNKMTHTTYKHREDDTDYLLKKESSLDGGKGSGAHDGREPMPNIAGPAVYYPPGEMFSSETARDSASAPLNPSGGGHAAGSSSKGKSKRKEKGKGSDSDGKQGAAVVPICLPLCCAAPCVIM